MPEILIVAGEPSGDAIAAELVRAAREVAPEARFFGATGPELEAAGAERVVATSDLSVMGFLEVVGRLPAIRRAMNHLAEIAEEREPAGAILVDSPDFNLRLAKRLDRRGVPAVQYVAPTVWAWRAGRVRTIRRHVRRLLVTLPFEPAVYEGTGVDAVYVGNPAADRVAGSRPGKAAVAARLGGRADAPWVGLVPGSRAAEIERMGPLLAAAAARLREVEPALELIVPVAPGVEAATVARSLAGGPTVRLVAERRLEALGACDAAIATSGTVSLELALLGVPHAVAYRTSAVSWAIARALVDLDHVALPNLIAGRTVVPEYLQTAATPDALAAPVATWLAEPASREAVAAGLAEVAAAVGPAGTARRAARAAFAALLPGEVAPGV